ncbi:type III polyketide synthase [Motilibacter sp. E257]|uniref:Type III polyketide synthase n=2 Tax=Motilibacter deserti TaxID=2714956 RepID=A0ABX0GXW5_9ACTN|nr:type III polyketide synthase [Motilibacter deserti]
MPQAVLRDLMAAQPGLTPLARRLVRTVYDASGIETRHTVLDELEEAAAGGPVFFDHGSGHVLTPSTGTRNAAYARLSRELFVEAGRRALKTSGLEAEDVTHVVTVSCTGFFAPGPDYLLVRELGLPPSTRRLHVGFMGCYGAFPALRAARSTCQAEPDAVVLVVCVELCTLHLHVANDPDTIVSSSVFADGAAAAVVTARPAPAGEPTLTIESLETVLSEQGEQDMAWTIGDQGFDMVLSSYVPRIIEADIRGALDPLLGDRDAAGIEHWAVHPGGRSILDRVQSALGLDDAQLAPSRGVLRDYGNVSSATVLFVLREILHSRQAGPASVVAVAFGPGLTVETGLLTLGAA